MYWQSEFNFRSSTKEMNVTNSDLIVSVGGVIGEVRCAAPKYGANRRREH